MSKKLFVLLAVVLLALAACGQPQPDPNKVVKPTEAETSESEQADTPDSAESPDAEATDEATNTPYPVPSLFIPTPYPEPSDNITGTTTEEITGTATMSPYPIQDTRPTAWDKPYPAPTISWPPTPSVATDDERGAVRGTLLDMDGEPISALYVFLAVEGEQGILQFDLTTSQRGIVYEDGSFTIPLIQPGEYALAVWTPMNQPLITDPNNANVPLKVKVNAGEITEVGEIQIERP